MMGKTVRGCISWHGCLFLHPAAFQNKKFCSSQGLPQIPLPRLKGRCCYRGAGRCSAVCCPHTHRAFLLTVRLLLKRNVYVSLVTAFGSFKCNLRMSDLTLTKECIYALAGAGHCLWKSACKTWGPQVDTWTTACTERWEDTISFWWMSLLVVWWFVKEKKPKQNKFPICCSGSPQENLLPSEVIDQAPELDWALQLASSSLSWWWMLVFICS